MANVPPFSELIAATTRSAVHLEMRDAYTPTTRGSCRWKPGEPRASSRRARPGGRLVRDPYGQGRPVPAGPDRVRAARRLHPVRARDHGRLNVAAGEEVRWLPRRRASDLCLPGNDFWVLDGRLVRFGYFAGDGEFVEDELSEDPA